MHGDTHDLVSGKMNYQIKEKYYREQTDLFLSVFFDQKVLSAKIILDLSYILIPIDRETLKREKGVGNNLH